LTSPNPDKQRSSADTGFFRIHACYRLSLTRKGKNNWTKVLRDILASFATSCPMYRRLGRTAEARASYEKALALAQQEPERQFLQEWIRQLK